MREFKQCVEREEIIFNVQVKDENAPVEFFMQNGEQILPDPPRVEILNLGEGKHQLVIHKAEMGDMGTISAKTPSNKGDEELESKSAFTVIKGEEAPKIGDVAPVTGTAKKQCNMTIPYSVEGEKQSEMEIFVEKDGKILKIGKDIQLTVHGDRVQLDIINPKREKSGVYKVIMRNAQGTIHILLKHLYNTKFNLTSKFFTKTGFFFRQNKRIYFSTLHFDVIFMLYFGILRT
jgi:hypothetical protein